MVIVEYRVLISDRPFKIVQRIALDNGGRYVSPCQGFPAGYLFKNEERAKEVNRLIKETITQTLT